MTRQLFALGIGAFAVLKEELHGVRLLHSEIQALCAGNRGRHENRNNEAHNALFFFLITFA